jgi:hypothetical protein
MAPAAIEVYCTVLYDDIGKTLKVFEGFLRSPFSIISLTGDDVPDPMEANKYKKIILLKHSN